MSSESPVWQLLQYSVFIVVCATPRALRWRNIFVIPIIIFPIAATVVHTIVVLKTSSVKPTDDLHCDSSDPEW